MALCTQLYAQDKAGWVCLSGSGAEMRAQSLVSVVEDAMRAKDRRQSQARFLAADLDLDSKVRFLRATNGSSRVHRPAEGMARVHLKFSIRAGHRGLLQVLRESLTRRLGAFRRP